LALLVNICKFNKLFGGWQRLFHKLLAPRRKTLGSIHMIKILQTIVVFALSVFLTGCMTIAQSIMGIKDTKKLSDKEIIKTAKSFKVDKNASYRLDTTYLSYILNLDTAKFKAQRKNHIQPMQALYFNANGQLVKFYINCYAGGILKLKWNRNKNLETFLPKDQAPIDTLLDLKKQISYLRPLGASPHDILAENADYYVFIYWSKCTKRHSKRLIRCIKRNVAKATTEKVKTIFVSYDNVFYKFEHR
jgi:hypothetical protein